MQTLNKQEKQNNRLEKDQPGDAENTKEIQILEWTLKTINMPKTSKLTCLAISITVPLVFFLITTWNMWKNASNNIGDLIFFTTANIIPAFWLLSMVRRKTIFNYKINTQHGSVDYHLHYPDLEKAIYISLLIAAILAVIIASLLANDFFLLLVIIPFVILQATILIKNWEPPKIEHEDSHLWTECRGVLIDRKQRIVVAYQDECDYGFDARLPDLALLDTYVAFLREALPADARFHEGTWPW